MRPARWALWPRLRRRAWLRPEGGVAASAMAVVHEVGPSCAEFHGEAASEAVPTRRRPTIMGLLVMRSAKDAEVGGVLNAKARADGAARA